MGNESDDGARPARLGVMEIVTATAIMAFSGPLTRFAAMPSMVMTFVRCSVPALILGIVILRNRRRSPAKGGGPGQTLRLAAASVLNAARIFLFYQAFALTSIGNAVVMLYTWPVFATVFGMLILKEAVRPRDALLLAAALAGVGVVYSGSTFSFSDEDFLGMTLMLVSAAVYALMLTLIRREGVGRLRATFWQNLAGAVVFLPAALGALGELPGKSWAWSATNGLAVGTLAFFLFFSSLERLPAAVVGHLSYLEVVFALCWAAVLFGEAPTVQVMVGGGLIVASMILRAELARRESASKAPERVRSTGRPRNP